MGGSCFLVLLCINSEVLARVRSPFAAKSPEDHLTKDRFWSVSGLENLSFLSDFEDIYEQNHLRIAPSTPILCVTILENIIYQLLVRILRVCAMNLVHRGRWNVTIEKSD